MKFHKTPIALAVVAACGALPLAAQAAPTVSWNAPMNGAALRGNVSGSACAVTTSSDTDRVTFWADNWQINNDYSRLGHPDADHPDRVDAGAAERLARCVVQGAASRRDRQRRPQCRQLVLRECLRQRKPRRLRPG